MGSRRVACAWSVLGLIVGIVVFVRPGVHASAVEPLPPVCGTWVLQQVSSVADLDRMRPQLDAALATPGVRGLSVRAGWNAVDGDLSIFDRAYEISQAAGKDLSIRVMAGRFTPARVFAAGAYSYVDQKGDRVPKPFSDNGTAGNPVFELEYQKLVTTLATWSRNHGVSLLHLPWYGHLWAEIDNGAEMQATKGYSVDAWTQGHLNLLDIGLAASSSKLAVEYPMSGYWGGYTSEAKKFHDRIVATVGSWSPRIFLQGNAAGVYNFNPASGRPINDGLQMYDGGTYDWSSTYGYAASIETSYLEVYTSSFTGDAGSLSQASRNFMTNFDASCLYASGASSSPTPTPTPSPSIQPSPEPDPSPSTSTTTASPSPTSQPTADSVDPETTLSTPKSGKVPLGAITMSGSASDDTGVSAVTVAIRDKKTRLWLRSDGTWGAYQAYPAALGTPGARSTGWTLGWTPLRTGSYILVITARDRAGNLDPSPAGASLTVYQM
jgi:hypothetical protein